MVVKNPRSKPIGQEMMDLVTKLYPICRSITGDGVRESLHILQQEIPLTIHEVPSGTQVFDWEVPQEWNIKDAYIKDQNGNRVVDFKQSNLHVVNGSMPINTTLSWEELKQKLHTLPNQPDLIPYRTCFHVEDWGFCLSHDLYQHLEAKGNTEYQVVIESNIIAGSLTYGELFIPGETEEEVLLSSHICHPSLANDNLSGIAVAVELAKHLSQKKRRYGYRFVFAPATIGAITWISQNKECLKNIKHGLILSLLGDAGCSTYKKTRDGNLEIDQAVKYVLNTTESLYEINEFEPFGYDERQYCSPGINLALGCFMRTPNGQYPEYHTSADNLDLVKPLFLADSLDKLKDIIAILEGNETLLNLKPYCEPRLGKHGLYKAFGCSEDQAEFQRAILWVLNQCDGTNSLLDIAQKSGVPFARVRQAADELITAQLLSSPSQERANSEDSLHLNNKSIATSVIRNSIPVSN